MYQPTTQELADIKHQQELRLQGMAKRLALIILAGGCYPCYVMLVRPMREN